MEPCGARTRGDGYFTDGCVAARIADDRLDRPGSRDLQNGRSSHSRTGFESGSLQRRVSCEPDTANTVPIGFLLCRLVEFRAFGALEYAWEKLRLSQVYAGHHPHNRASEKILKKLGFEFIGNVFYEPTGLMHPSYVCKAPPPRRNASTSP